MNLTGKTALVSGAGGPMGRAVVKQLIGSGVTNIAITDISQNRLAETHAEISQSIHPKHISALRTDVTIADEVEMLTTQVLNDFGQVDLLVNMVGGIRSTQLYTPFLEMNETQWCQTFDLNLMGGFHLMQQLAPGMIERKYGRIVNITTIVFDGESGQADYAAAKAAVASMTRSLAAEFAPNVTVNCVAPGMTRTSVTQNIAEEDRKRLIGQAYNQRMAEPTEIASAINYFLSEDARFVTGEILAVSGGIHPHL